LRSNIRELGYEQGVVATIEAFLDEFAQYRQDQRQMVELLDECVNLVQKMMHVGDGITRQIDELKRVQEQGNED